jgi:plastocyanin
MTIVEERSDAEPPAVAPARPAPSRGSTFETLSVCGFIFGLFAVVISIFAVGLAGRAVSEAGDDGGGDGGGGGATTAEVAMSDFAFDPSELLVATDAVITLVNEGAVVHNMSVDGTASDMVDAGAEGELDLTGVAPGTYEYRCDVPGHAEAGMVGSITIG